jgi:hypothetical protein
MQSFCRRSGWGILTWPRVGEFQVAAGDDYRTLIEAGAIRVRGEGENGLIEMGRLPTPEQGAVLRDLYLDKKTIHVFLRRIGGVWRQGDNATIEGISHAEKWFSDKFEGESG